MLVAYPGMRETAVDMFQILGQSRSPETACQARNSRAYFPFAPLRLQIDVRAAISQAWALYPTLPTHSLGLLTIASLHVIQNSKPTILNASKKSLATEVATCKPR